MTTLVTDSFWNLSEERLVTILKEKDLMEDIKKLTTSFDRNMTTTPVHFNNKPEEDIKQTEGIHISECHFKLIRFTEGFKCLCGSILGIVIGHHCVCIDVVDKYSQIKHFPICIEHTEIYANYRFMARLLDEQIDIQVFEDLLQNRVLIV